MSGDYTLVSAWARSMRARNLSASTVTTYRQTISQLLVWCQSHHRELRTLTYRDIEGWLADCHVEARSRHAYISRVSTLYSWMIREEIVDHDPTKRIDRPRLHRRLPRPAPTDAVRAVIETGEPRTAAMVALAAFAGMRRFEVAQLRVEDLFLRREPATVLVHGKGQKERILVLNDAAVRALYRHGLPASGCVFSLTPAHAGKLVADALSDAVGERVTMHQLRHWFASEIYAATHDLRLTQEVMGHQSPATTAIYAAFSNTDAERAVAGLSVTLDEQIA